ncbi:fumarylacetoacetate hydrolase family protein [Nocardioides sp. Iso805N]|uniref:fumarylacetoacetate hydrolase family protein n=1 Tax=Nocardioides sp. Iso805N TaxID=1283287 RepID=UPI000379C6FE|nr:fumarylacetoacetate hydrolase family protein [Nocardioides sp. Iso805N]
MRLASVHVDGVPHAARLEGDRLVLLPQSDVRELLEQDDWRSLAAADGDVVPVDAAELRPVVPDPPKIICMGRNYAEHVAEGGHELPEAPVLFAKHSASLCAPYADIPMPTVSEQLDWEVELAFVIGKAGRAVPREDALDHVAGYTVSNDFSVRDWQNRTKQWHAGKAWDGLTPLGPVLVTDDELPPGATGLDVTCEVDGVVMQKGNTAQFIFDVPTMITDISTFTRLEPGDVILTGTPSGVGNARDPKVFLRPGQTVVTRVDGVGELRNTVVG